MKKSFNDTGVCLPKEHYMVDISNKLSKIFSMIERGNYFIINRPRQYGKTTTIAMLNLRLSKSDNYFPIELSFEGISEASYKNETVFLKTFILLLKTEFENSGYQELATYIDSQPILENFTELGLCLNHLIEKIGKNVVLIIDEVDKSSNNQLFLDFIGMLRNKFLKRGKPGEYTFHSVILAGVHNVRNLKLKIRPESEAKYNSPWNIAADFDVEMNFNPAEISTMLKQYVEETGIQLDIETVANTLYYYTSGYPFLVSKLCKIIDEKILPEENRNQWNNTDVERAVNRLLKEFPTNFESVIKNLENNKELFDDIENILLRDIRFDFFMYDKTVNFGVTHGIFEIGGSIKN